VTFHLSRPDPDFLFELSDFAYAAPLPAGVPDHNSHKEPLPGTGPYEISTVNQRGIFYVRNPYFHEWSYAAQPNGNPDRIIWENTKSHAQSIWRVERGRADWTWDAISPSQLRAERVRSPAQLHSNPIYAVEFLPLNTHLAPFNNLLVRKALNFAIDRNKIADMYGGSYAAQPSCQPLTPGLMGYSRYCPYTKQPSADGTYHGPDLARARRLVARSGTRGDRITVIGATNELVVPREESAYVGRVLRSLGYRVRVDVLPRASITPAMQRRAQIQTTGDWLADYPTPSSYVPALFACHGGLTNGYVCNPRLDREMADAVSLQNSRPRRAGILWRRVDHQIARAAYWVPTVDESSVDLVSKRLRNYQFSPLWGFIPDQAWINE
jgi:peptide/nickel transport system substrate-binding protein